MLSEKRHEIILDLLRKKGSITVVEIRDQLGISESTIRRDLNQLDREGRLTKVFGGAVLKENTYLAKELSVPEKLHVNEDEKRVIARYAASLIKPDDYVYLDAGTTTGYMIDYIIEKDATYVTNAVDHAKRLGAKEIHVILVGGELRGNTEAVVGAQAILTLQKHHFTKGFFGTNGISPSYGLTTPDASEALVKETAIGQCDLRYILSDESKFDEVSSVTFADFNDVDIITNAIPKGYEKYQNLIDVMTN